MLRDPLQIFKTIKEDLKNTYNTPKVGVVGSRVTKKTSGKNDFDVVALVPSLEDLKKAMGPERLLFCQQLIALENIDTQDPDSLFNTYLYRTMPVLRRRWAGLRDEYNNPVKVDIVWITGDFPRDSIII